MSNLHDADLATGLERMQRDPRSTAELIETALTEAELADDQIEDYLAIAVLHARGTREVSDAALVLCGSPAAKRRALGARILGQLGPHERTFPEECCDALLDLVRRDQNEEVLTAAIFALGHLGNRRSDPDLAALRRYPNDDLRHAVAFALAGATSSTAVEALLELMEDSYCMARDWATTGIGGTVALDGPEIREALLRRVLDEDEITRAEALHGLARRHDKRVVPYLMAELPIVRDRAYLFADAAKAFLGLDEERDFEPAELLAALQSQHGPS